MQKPYRFVHTNPQTLERAISSEFGRGLAHARFARGHLWEHFGFANHSPLLYNRCRFPPGFSKVRIIVEILQRLKPDNHQTAKTLTIPISQQSLQIPWGMQCRNGPHYSKHNPPHTPRLIIQSEFAKIRMEQMSGTKTGKSNQTQCEEYISPTILHKKLTNTPK